MKVWIYLPPVHLPYFFAPLRPEGGKNPAVLEEFG
jgi:hypothetical protein